MRILVLDDLEQRHKLIHDLYPEHELVHTYTYTQFIDQLQLEWDIIYLDHDLGDVCTYIDGWGNICGYNGLHAVMRICEIGKLTKVIIHSSNSVGAQAMLQMLLRFNIEAIWKPF